MESEHPGLTAQLHPVDFALDRLLRYLLADFDRSSRLADVMLKVRDAIRRGGA